jgi:hypothetical protein
MSTLVTKIAAEFMEFLIHPSAMYPDMGKELTGSGSTSLRTQPQYEKTLTVIGEHNPKYGNRKMRNHALAKFHGIPWGVAGTISFVQLLPVLLAINIDTNSDIG